MKTTKKIVANLGKNGISTVWAAVICIYLAAINVISFFFAEDLSIAGTVSEMVLWCLICTRLSSEQKIKKDMCILIIITYGTLFLSNMLSFLEKTTAAALGIFLIEAVSYLISLILMWIRYDGAMKKYAMWSIICFVGCNAVSLIFGDPAEWRNAKAKVYMSMLLVIPYFFLFDILREGDGDEDSDENDIEVGDINETNVASNTETTSKNGANGKFIVNTMAFILSAVVIIFLVLFGVEIYSDSQANTEYGSAFIKLEENTKLTPRDNYYWGTIVVSANKDGYTNIREKPNAASAIVGIMCDGVKSERNVNGVDCEVWENYAKLYEREGNWLHVETNGAEGYVHASQVKIIESGIAVEK